MAGAEPDLSATDRVDVAAREIAVTLARDPVVRATLALLVVGLLLYLLPVVSSDWLANFSTLVLDLPLIALLIVGCLWRLGRVDQEDRGFWFLLTAAFSCWLVQQVLGWVSFELDWTAVGFSIAEAVLYVVLYMFLSLAFEQRLGRDGDSRARSRLSNALKTTGTSLFAFGMLIYFAAIPGAAGIDPWDNIAPGLLLYVVLDVYLVIRLSSLRSGASDQRWRTIYSWLLAMACSWVVLDLTEALMWAEVVPWVDPGSPLDLLWLASFPLGIAAIRVREHTFPEASSDTRTSPVRHLWGGHLVVFAMSFPLVHLVLYRTTLLDPDLRPARETCVLIFLLALAVLAVRHQRVLQGDNERLEAQRAATLEQIRHQALHDPLTGAANRYLLSDRLEMALAQCGREGLKLAVLFCDLDGFKQVNDTFGHHLADRLLKRVSERMQACLRGADTLARAGGDEFTVVLQGIDSEADAESVAQKLQESVGHVFVIDGHELTVTMSIGISLFPDDAETATMLVENADAAMYTAKAESPGSIRRL